MFSLHPHKNFRHIVSPFPHPREILQEGRWYFVLLDRGGLCRRSMSWGHVFTRPCPPPGGQRLRGAETGMVHSPSPRRRRLSTPSCLRCSIFQRCVRATWVEMPSHCLGAPMRSFAVTGLGTLSLRMGGQVGYAHPFQKHPERAPLGDVAPRDSPAKRIHKTEVMPELVHRSLAPTTVVVQFFSSRVPCAFPQFLASLG